jgi:hypothetical protein
LILVEGIPGSGKSTTAQFLARRLARHGIPVKWWYEEEKAHPLYIFHDQASMQQVVTDLFSGNHQQVVQAALGKWRAFAEEVGSSEHLVMLESCLFGYLTWSLFPADVPSEEILEYVAQVEQLIGVHDPALIYLYQDDVARALQTMCARRGDGAAESFVRKATLCPYGKHRGLQGFEGLVTFWSDYRALTDMLFSRLRFQKVAIENAAGDWPAYYCRALEFLGVPPGQEMPVSDSYLERFAGTYRATDGAARTSCVVKLEDGALYLHGAPQVWPWNRLIPESHNTFSVVSLPFEVTFEADASGVVRKLRVSGPALLRGTIEHVFLKEA